MKLISGIIRPKYPHTHFLIFVLVISCLVCPKDVWCKPEEEKLRNEINAILDKHKLFGSVVGINIFSISKNKTLYKHNSGETFVVASNVKLFTTAAALEYLGPDFEYITKINYHGDISEGKLDGDIIIKGSGDPNISGRFYCGNITAVPALWADAVKEMGIKTIVGDIIADDSIFDREFICDSWPEDQLSEWYCAPISGLSFNDNCIDIIIKPSRKPGAYAQIHKEPETSYVTLNNNCKTSSNKSKDSYSYSRRPQTNLIDINGYIWIKSQPQREWVTITNPPLYTATVFKEILEHKNIIVAGDARVIGETDMELNHEHHPIIETSSSLKQAIEVTNKRSQGFYAEQVLKTMGAYIKKEGSFIAGISVIEDLITKMGFSEDQYNIADGSGLSKKNKLTPDIIISLLRFMYGHKHSDIFLGSLSVSGIDGTLKKRLTKVPYKSRIRAKTGYVKGASTLSGYAQTLHDEVIAFSILVNKIKGSISQTKSLQDAICRVLVTSN